MNLGFERLAGRRIDRAECFPARLALGAGDETFAVESHEFFRTLMGANPGESGEVSGFSRNFTGGRRGLRRTIEDFSGSTEVLVFPEKWSALADHVKTDVPLLMKGGYSRRDQDADNPSFVVESVTKLAELRANGQVMIAIELRKDPSRTTQTMHELRAIVEAYPGTVPLELEYSDGNGLRATLRSRSLTLAVNSTALSELRSRLGNDSVRLQRGSR